MSRYKAQIVTIEPAAKITKWRIIIKVPGCTFYEAKLHGHRVYGVEWNNECLWRLVETGVVGCIGDCSVLRNCHSYLLGSGSLVADCGGSIAKLYLVEPSSPEAKLLAILSQSRLVPGIAARLVYRGETIGVVEEKLSGEPLAARAQRELRNYMEGVEKVEVLPLAAKTLALVHALLKSMGKECRIEPGKRAAWYLQRLPQSLAEELAPLYPRIMEAEKTSYSLTTCQPVHQDPHLYQFLTTSTSTFLIDFSGEPLRAPIGGPYEPPLRDVAVLLRSASYIATMAISDSSPENKNKGRLVNRVVEWLEHSVHGALETYLAHGVLEDPGTDLSLLPVLVLERLVYEAWYEHLYGTRLLRVILAALHDARLLPELGVFLRR